LVSIPPFATSVTWTFESTGPDCVSPNVSVVSVTSVDPVTYTCTAFVDEKGKVYSEENVEAYDVTGKKIAEGKRFY
jgi:hypothetical protein